MKQVDRQTDRQTDRHIDRDTERRQEIKSEIYGHLCIIVIVWNSLLFLFLFYFVFVLKIISLLVSVSGKRKFIIFVLVSISVHENITSDRLLCETSVLTYESCRVFSEQRIIFITLQCIVVCRWLTSCTVTKSSMGQLVLSTASPRIQMHTDTTPVTTAQGPRSAVQVSQSHPSTNAECRSIVSVTQLSLFGDWRVIAILHGL